MESSYASERPAGAGTAPAGTAWIGMVVFAGILMLTLGTFQIVEGVVALYRADFYPVAPDRLLVSTSYTAWGWTHVILGVITVATGAGVLLGQLWARVLGIVITAGAALVHFGFLTAAPVWCSILIGMQILVIYALAVHGRDVRPYRST
ncbi:hypothetical protein AB0F81_38800 [Actinoplanes sp. NPDC024001]|uniref:DUF7144 family membrane protein n=1 Tax=Actinoplanes sp. NPDC024001 TaxID=3154598 RepID=UPI0033D0E455